MNMWNEAAEYTLAGQSGIGEAKNAISRSCELAARSWAANAEQLNHSAHRLWGLVVRLSELQASCALR